MRPIPGAYKNCPWSANRLNQEKKGGVATALPATPCGAPAPEGAGVII